MRRGLASLIIGLSLLVASASWAGFTLSRTVLDPGRSERLAAQLLDNPDVRQALVIRLADALEDQIPPEVPVRRDLLELGAARALDDPRVEALVLDGVVRVHQNALAGNDEPVVIDAGDLGAAGRDALVLARPELAPVLPASPTVQLELPTAGLSRLGDVKRFVDRYTLVGALIAATGALVALAVARHRAPVLRRVAFWGYGAAAFWLAVGYGVPWLAGNLSPTSAAIASAAADVFFGAMIGPAAVMALVATALLAAGLALPALEGRRGARALHPRRPVPTQARPRPGPSTGRDSTDEMPLPLGAVVHPPVVDHSVIGGGDPGWRRDIGIDITFRGLDDDAGAAGDPVADGGVRTSRTGGGPVAGPRGPDGGPGTGAGVSPWPDDR